MKEIILTTEEIEYFKKHGFDVNSNMPIFMDNAFSRKDCLNELKEGEIWMGNIDIRKKEEYLTYRSFIPSLRIGEQAYDIKGNPIARFDSRPLFINKNDEQAYDNFRMKKTAGNSIKIK